jgi:hypothetical protein
VAIAKEIADNLNIESELREQLVEEKGGRRIKKTIPV